MIKQLLQEVQELRTRLVELERLKQEKYETEKLAQERLLELEKFQKVTIDRELRMVELKKQIKLLEQQLAKKGGMKTNGDEHITC